MSLRHDLRVVIMSVNVNLPLSSSRSIVATRVSIIANCRHYDPRPASLIDGILEVIGVREFRPAAGTAVFVFRLVEDHGSAIGDLVLGNKRADVRYITDTG